VTLARLPARFIPPAARGLATAAVDDKDYPPPRHH
jgi:hypothetical protein